MHRIASHLLSVLCLLTLSCFAYHPVTGVWPLDDRGDDIPLLGLLAGAASAQTPTAPTNPGTLNAQAATMSLDASVPYFTAQSIALASTTPGASIWYTTDGSDPTCNTGTQYSAAVPLPVKTKLTIKTITCASGMTPATSTATYLNAPVLVGGYDTPGFGGQLVVSGNHAYIADGNSLQIIDVSDPTNPVFRGSLGIVSRAVDVVGTLAYVVETTILRVVDVSNPAAPVQTGSVAVGTQNSDVRVSGSFAYVAGDTSGSVYTVNISNPMAPTLADTYSTQASPPNDAESQPRAVHVAGNYAYFAETRASGSGKLLVFDMTTPSSIALSSSYFPGGGRKEGIFVSGTTAYLGDGGGFWVIDASNPAAPSVLGSVNPGGGWHRNVYASGSYAFISEDNSGFRIIDVSNPAAPTYRSNGSSAGVGIVQGLFISGKYAYVGDNTFGLKIYQVFP